MARTDISDVAPAGRIPPAGSDRERIDDVAIKAFMRMADEWALNVSERIRLLGNPSKRTFYRWREGKISSLPDDTLERISVLLGIYKSLHVLLPLPDRANGWLKRPNEAFGERSALDVMLQGKVDDLYQVRRHLDAWRG